MTQANNWRTAFLGGDVKLHNEWVEMFKPAYAGNGKPDNMAIYTHNDSMGAVMAVSITPQSIPHCPFSGNWSENHGLGDFGHIGWTGGDERLKNIQIPHQRNDPQI